MSRDGKINYFKDIVEHKGTINLSKDTKVIKTGRNQIEIPIGKRHYILIDIPY